MQNIISLSERRKDRENATPSDLLSVKEFAAEADMKIGYLYKLIAGGKIKRYKRGVWKISRAQVLQFLNGVK